MTLKCKDCNKFSFRSTFIGVMPKVHMLVVCFLCYFNPKLMLYFKLIIQTHKTHIYRARVPQIICLLQGCRVVVNFLAYEAHICGSNSGQRVRKDGFGGLLGAFV